MRVIAGTARGKQLKTPEGALTRPTADRVKEAVFSIVQFDLPGSRVLDLFAGTGQMGIEALSRGAKDAVFIDERKDACRLVQENLKRTGFTDQAKVIQSGYLSYLKHTREQFDLIILDPPYLENYLENALKTISEIDILSDRGIIICERPAEKAFDVEFSGLTRGKDYRYGKTWITLFRKASFT